MKRITLVFTLFLGICAVNAQINLLTEDFETNGEGTRYTSNSFDDACHDFFERYSNGGGNCLTNEPTNINGTFYWAGEDVDVASGGTGIVTLDPLTVTDYNLELQVMAAIGRPNDGRFETSDELLFQYNMDGSGWVTFGAFYGNNGTGQGNLALDADLDGAPDIGGPKISSFNFTDWTFPIPVTGNSLQVRFIMGQNTGTEEIMVDNIRINGTVVLPIELLRFSLSQIESGKVKIDWQTALEVNNDQFTVERSHDANNWQDVARVKGAGNSSILSDYTTIDDNPYSGISYYRLKQSDYDGQVSYSSIKQINLESKGPGKVISIYPNPAHNELTIEGDKNELSTFQIFNALGQDVTNIASIDQHFDNKLKVDISRLSKGVYFVKTKSIAKRVYISNNP